MAKRFVWFDLVDREGKTIQRDGIQLPENVIEIQFRNALTDSEVYKNNHIKGVYAEDLKVYAQWGQKCLGPDKSLAGYGVTAMNPLLVEIPKIWYKLFSAGTRKPIAAATSVPFADSSTVTDLRIAIKIEYDCKTLKDIAVSNLKLYKNLKVYRDPAGIPLENPMKSSKTLVSCGMDEDHALIVEVPVPVRIRAREDASQEIELPAKKRRLNNIINSLGKLPRLMLQMTIVDIETRRASCDKISKEIP